MAILLYVDDEQSIGRAVSRWFGRRGHTVLVATSVGEAQRVLAEHEPNVLFLDVWLGQRSGFELMSWIEDARPQLADRVVFVTGDLPGSVRGERLWRTLGRPVLHKPFDFAQLEAFVADPGGDSIGAPPPGPGADAEPRAGT